MEATVWGLAGFRQKLPCPWMKLEGSPDNLHVRLGWAFNILYRVTLAGLRRRTNREWRWPFLVQEKIALGMPRNPKPLTLKRRLGAGPQYVRIRDLSS